MANLIQGGFLAGKKTYVVSVTGILGALGLYLTGDADLATTFQTVFTMLAATFLRSGMK